MVIEVRSSTLNGADAFPVTVEVETHNRGEEFKFNIIGLADTAVRESRGRVVSSLRKLGYRIPKGVLVNLAPAELKKEGSAFDLAIALGVLIASKQLSIGSLEHCALHGELSLSGQLKPIRGVVALAAQAVSQGVKVMVLPRANCREAALFPGLEVVGLGALSEVVEYFQGRLSPEKIITPREERSEVEHCRLSEVNGQHQAKRALLIAAAGGHNLLMVGPPGCGKTMLAERFVGLLPPLKGEELIEVVKIHSIAGLEIKNLLQGQRPYRAPHHMISDSGLVGGGSNPRPGEISLAHHGVLFLDEFPEFKRSVIESIRVPLEQREVTIARARYSAKYRASFQLIAAMNPCPCGKAGASPSSCVCSRAAIESYLRKLSQPILDRIDLHIDLDPVPLKELATSAGGREESSDEVYRKQVEAARLRALERSGDLNSSLNNEGIRSSLNSEICGKKLIEKIVASNMLSARGFFKMLKVARTIADLRGSDKVQEVDVAEAVRFREIKHIVATS